MMADPVHGGVAQYSQGPGLVVVAFLPARCKVGADRAR